MRLNAQTDYSLRLLMYLAAKEVGTVTIQEASNQMDLSQTHMMRIAAKLAAKGLVTSTRGRSGGISLGRDASLITVEDVVRAIEPDFALVECFGVAKHQCSIEPACLLKGALHSALEAFFAELRSVTLGELTRANRTRLSDVFHLNDPLSYVAPRRVRVTSNAGALAEGGN